MEASLWIYTDKIMLDWSSVADADRYIVYVSEDGRWPYTWLASTTEPNFEIHDVTSSRNYYYKVRSVKGDEKSSYSTTARGIKGYHNY